MVIFHSHVGLPEGKHHVITGKIEDSIYDCLYLGEQWEDIRYCCPSKVCRFLLQSVTSQIQEGHQIPA